MAGMLLDPVQMQGVFDPRCEICESESRSQPRLPPSVSIHSEDKAVEHTITPGTLAAHRVPGAKEKREVAQRLLQDSMDTSLYEDRGGACRIKRLPGVLGTHCSAFGECPGCSVARIRKPEPRQRFRGMLIERELRTSSSSRPVRAVSIGCGGLLTDFECMLGLWTRGCTIESFVAIDTAYSSGSHDHGEYMQSLRAMAAFFSPCRVYSFSSSEDYIAAARRRPQIFGDATLFIHCDAGAVPDDQYKDAAAVALRPGGCVYELWNVGWGHHSTRPPLEDLLPPRLQISTEGQTGGYSLGVLRKREGVSSADVAHGSGAQLLEDVKDSSLGLGNGYQSKRIMEEAVVWLEQSARQRAADYGKQLFKVVYDTKPRMAVRDAPTRSAAIAGARKTGDEVIVDEVTADGWVRVSRELDTWAGYQNYRDDAAAKDLWMLIRADDVGELLREVVLDDRGEEIDDDSWMPDLV